MHYAIRIIINNVLDNHNLINNDLCKYLFALSPHEVPVLLPAPGSQASEEGRQRQGQGGAGGGNCPRSRGTTTGSGPRRGRSSLRSDP